MRIEKLEIKGFGKLKNISLTLDKGLNIIFGSNEAGKSTIQWFIKAMLFGIKGGKASKEGVPPPLKRFKPWSESDYAGFMEYRLDDGQLYRIGRNFSTNSVRIFDSLFNDVTNSFDASKERGIHFAEKHLGLNEVCFEKTVFIRQMDAKIGEDGSKELYNKIVNISESGFEDVSFKKAQEALKDALKNYVGTEKTSTRPLDKVVEKLTELRMKREELLSKRDSMFSVESEINSAITIRTNLQEKKAFLGKLIEIMELSAQVEKCKKIKNQAQEILDSINSDEEELKLINERAEEFNKTKDEFNNFSIYDNEDVDEIDRNYLRLLDRIQENRRLRNQIDNKERELDENRKCIEPILAFSTMGEGIEDRVIEISKSLEQLKKDYDRSDIEQLNVKISTAQKKVKNYKLNSVLSAVATLILFGGGLKGVTIGFAVAIPVLLLASILLYLGTKESGNLSKLLDEKRMSFINISSIKEEMIKKQQMLSDIYAMVDAKGLEDFLKRKAEYDAQSKLVAALNGDISRLENENLIDEREISKLKGEIIAKLIEAGIVDNEDTGFGEEHINKFKYGVRRYKGMEPSIKYTAQRLEDINRSLEKHMKSAIAICDGEYESKECLQGKISLLESQKHHLNKKIGDGIDDIKNSVYEGLYASVLPEIASSNEGLNLDFEDSAVSYSSIEDDYKKVSGDLENVLLNIREYETLLRSISSGEAELQRIEEEIEELESRKSQLEDINISLKTALDVLTEASGEIQRDFVPVLNHRMADVIKRVTAGKYQDLRADSSFSLNTLAPETGDVVAVSGLSGGTVDQMYLALRLSVADMVAQTGEKLPFIMDEVFAQYDDIRTKETFEYFKELSKRRQIVFFTCKGRELEIAKQVYNNEVNIIEI